MLRTSPTRADVELSRAANDLLTADGLVVSPRQVQRWHEYGAIKSIHRSLGRHGRESFYPQEAAPLTAEIRRQLARSRRLDTAVFLTFLGGHAVDETGLRRAIGRMGDTPLGGPPSDEDARWEVADQLTTEFLSDRGAANTYLRRAMHASGVVSAGQLAKDMMLTALGDPPTFAAEDVTPPAWLRLLGLTNLWADNSEDAADALTDVASKLSEISSVDSFLDRATMGDFEQARTEALAAADVMPVIGDWPAGLLGAFVAATQVAVASREGGQVF